MLNKGTVRGYKNKKVIQYNSFYQIKITVKYFERNSVFYLHLRLLLVTNIFCRLRRACFLFI